MIVFIEVDNRCSQTLALNIFVAFIIKENNRNRPGWECVSCFVIVCVTCRLRIVSTEKKREFYQYAL